MDHLKGKTGDDSKPMLGIWTIGHGRTPLNDIIAELDANGVEYLIDVRFRPLSRWNPEFNKKNLGNVLGHRYIFDGGRLGHATSFGASISEQARSAAIDDLERRVRQGERIAIMCSETDPTKCHRSEIANELARRGIGFTHLKVARGEKLEPT